MMNRRDVLNLAVAAGAATALLPSESLGKEVAEDRAGLRIVDTNVSLFHWPFRRLPLDDTEALVKKYRSLGIAQAWAGSFEGVLHRDIAGVNRRLSEACLNWPELIPIGSVNPESPGWEEDLRHCCEKLSMPGVRLHPNYHGYTLDDPRFAQLLNLATKAGRFVQIAATMEDNRTQHPKLVVQDVDLAPLVDVVKRIPGARVQLLNYKPRGPIFEQLAKTTNVMFDTARVDATDGIPKLVRSLLAGRVLFGTHAPFLIPEAALIRVHESGKLDDKALRAVYANNADSAFWKNGL
ncbi:MAG: amidohydrolase family protein [Planctomycetales bacterium]|jgi:predicted TIM-barrel fold metal-dependent hydrolase